jgi:hypothetical protein
MREPVVGHPSHEAPFVGRTAEFEIKREADHGIFSSADRGV